MPIVASKTITQRLGHLSNKVTGTLVYGHLLESLTKEELQLVVLALSKKVPAHEPRFSNDS